MLSSAQTFVNGMLSTGFDVNEARPSPPEGPAADHGSPDILARIVSVYQSNEFLIGELSSLNGKLASIEVELKQPGTPPRLVRAYHLQVKARRSAVLAMLRANRHRAHALLAETETETETTIEPDVDVVA